MKRVFLGGTCNGSTWRDEIETYLDAVGLDYFNPVVDDWTPDCQEAELQERKTCDFCVYALTPKMTGVYSIAEVTDDSNKRPKKTIFIILDRVEDEGYFTEGQLKSLEAVGSLVQANGAKFFRSLQTAANYMANN